MTGLSALFSLLMMTYGVNHEVEPPVSVIHYFNEKTSTYDIYCENIGPDFYSIELDFEELQGLRPSTPFPLRKTLEPGRHLLMRLSRRELHVEGKFKVKLTYRRGFINYDIKPEFPYLLPLESGTVAKLFCKDSLLSFYPGKTDSCFHVNGFTAHAGDTIFASRRGVVSKLRHLTADTSLHDTGLGYFLDIQHIDGTYGRYDGIQVDSPMIVSYGQLVEAGEPIAIVRKTSVDSTFFSFQVFYYDDRVVTDPIGPTNVKVVSIPIQFHNERLNSCAYCYEVKHPEEIITMEMNKRELRKWMRKTGKKGILPSFINRESDFSAIGN